MVLPDEEAQQGDAEHPRDREAIAPQGFAGEDRQQLEHDPEARHREDVHLRVAEEPEQVLEQVGAAASAGDEEGRVDGPVERRHQQRCDQHRRCQDHQDRGREDRPHEDRQPRPGQTRRAHRDDRRQHVQPEQRHRDADQREEDDVGVHPDHGLVVERLVAGPAGGEAAEEDRGGEDEAGCHQQPEGQRLDPRERHAPGADQDRHEVVRERPQDPRGHHPHHHRAVLADQGQVLVGPHDRRRAVQQLGADQHRVEPADEEEQADAAEVLDADDLVVGAEAEVTTDAVLLFLAQGRGPAEQPRDRVVGEAEADEEADHAAEVGQQQRDVVLVGRRGVFEAFSFGHEVADPPAEVVAADAEDHRAQQVESDQPPPQRSLCHRGLRCAGHAAHSPRLVGSGA